MRVGAESRGRLTRGGGAVLATTAGPVSVLPGALVLTREGNFLQALALLGTAIVLAVVLSGVFRVGVSRRRAGLFRYALIAVALTQCAVLALGIARFGTDGINLDSFDAQPAVFAWLVLVPAAAAALTTLLAVLPQIFQINLVVFIVLWLVAESVFGFITPPEPVAEGDPQSLIQPSYFLPDPVIGTRLAPDNRARHVKLVDGKPIYDVVYVIDRYGRRETPVDPAPDRARFLIFFGDSNTIGEGLNQNETMPYYAGQLAPSYRPYNYGVHGYGPAQMLDLLHTRDLSTEVPEREGYAVYFLIPVHMGRVIGSSELSASWARHFSHYVLAEDGTPRRVGNFVTGRPFLTLFYRLLNYSNIAHYFNLVLPLDYGAADFELVARIFAESRKVLQGERNVLDFVVILAPAYSEEQSVLLHKVGAALEAEGFRVLDFTHLFDTSDLRYRLSVWDAHNSALANRAIAEELIRRLGIRAAQ